LSLLLRLHNVLKDKRITNDKDISDLIELANDGLPNLRARFEVLLNQITALENEKNSLSNEILGLKNSIYTNNEIIRKQNVQLRSLTRKQSILEIMLRNLSKDQNYSKVTELVDQRLNDKSSLSLGDDNCVENCLGNCAENCAETCTQGTPEECTECMIDCANNCATECNPPNE
jgi:hypothetical protein